MKLYQKLFAVAVLVSPALANAAVDVSAVTAEITAGAAPVAAIGAGVLALMVGIKIYKWIRGAM